MKFFLLITLLFVSACAPSLHTTSGAAYLSACSDIDIDPDIAAAAKGGPDLQFPARVSIAFVTPRGLEAVPRPLVDAVTSQASKTGMGQIIPLNALLHDAAIVQTPKPNRYRQRSTKAVRISAAKQHADYLLMIRTEKSGRNGSVSAAFFDVRSGYIYATAQDSAYVGWKRQHRVSSRLARQITPQISQMIDALAAQAIAAP